MEENKKKLTELENGVLVEESLDDEFIELQELEKFNKKVAMSFGNLKDSNQARFTIDSYYQVQDMRINTANKIRADKQGLDNSTTNKKEAEEKMALLFYQYAMFKNNEDNLKKILDTYSDSNYLSRWARETMGIGPVLAASLPAYFDLKIEDDGTCRMHAGSWWNYAGLNDNNIPWLGREASKKIVEEAIKNNGGKLNEQAMAEICGKTHWKFEHFENFKDCLKKDKNGNPKLDKNGQRQWNKEAVIRASSVIPYNKKLKEVCWKIGTSFHKLCNNPKSLYGRLFKERLQYELEKNERGEYAEQAINIAKSKHFSNKEMEQIYLSGKLPISHIYTRCERYVTKLFISHAFEAAYYNHYGVMPPQPYALCFCEVHTDYIGPEVPYTSIKRDCEL